MTFTAADVEQAFQNGQFEAFSQWIANSNQYPNDDGWNAVDEWSEMGDEEGHVTLNDTQYEWRGVKRIGGGEGSGEYTAVIFEVDGRFFRKEGYYASHHGTDWDGDFSEVEEYEKIVKAYRTV